MDGEVGGEDATGRKVEVGGGGGGGGGVDTIKRKEER